MVIIFEGQFKGAVLMEELFDEFPEWLFPSPTPDPNLPEGQMVSLLRLDRTDAKIRLTVPEGTDVERVRAVLADHDPDKLSRNERKEIEQRQARGRAHAKLVAMGLTQEEVDAI